MVWELHMAIPLTLVLCEARATATKAELQPLSATHMQPGQDTGVCSREALGGAGQQTKERAFSY